MFLHIQVNLDFREGGELEHDHRLEVIQSHEAFLIGIPPCIVLSDLRGEALSDDRFESLDLLLIGGYVLFTRLFVRAEIDGVSEIEETAKYFSLSTLHNK